MSKLVLLGLLCTAHAACQAGGAQGACERQLPDDASLPGEAATLSLLQNRARGLTGSKGMLSGRDVSGYWVIGVPLGGIVGIILFNLLKQSKQPTAPPAMVPDVQSRLLAQNYKKENLIVGEDRMYSYQANADSFSGASHLLKYNEEEVTSFSAIFHLAGTRFNDPAMLKCLGVYWCIAAVLVIVIVLELDHKSGIDLTTQRHIDRFGSIRGDVELVVSFILGSSISMLVGRWWNVRHDCVGGLWGAVDDLCLILGAHMPSKEDRPLKETAVRLCLLSYRLVYSQIHGEETPEDLKKHVEAGIMTEEELEAIKDLDSKPQAVWVWLAQYVHGLADQGKIKYKEMMVPQLDALCAKGRGAIGELFTYTDTQIPYSYIHLLTMMVFLTNLVIAVKAGLAIGRNLESHETFDSMDVLTEMCHLSIIPFFYHSFVKLGCELSNPIGTDFFDLPGYAYHVFMRNEAMAFIKAAERAPSYVKEGKAEA
mmetsp:Transcript_122875/g.381905  ORF Transcript_122875/g.381905 Transcript_122875/m.381905 type:complete len:482 (-) Transcript_122875:109-1554(-)